jgi:hypothetical protein
MTRRSFLLPVLFAAAASSGCSTIVLESHRRPVEPKLAFERTVVIVRFPEENGSERGRRVAENELAGELAALNASPSFRLIAAGDLRDSDQVKSWAVAEGFDGLVLIWLVHSTVTRLPSLSAEGGPTLPARYIVSFRLKASVVSLKEDREVWTGVVEQLDPYPLTKSLPTVARAVARKLRAEGLVD